VSIEPFNFLSLWVARKGQVPNIGFLAHQVMSIVGFQIEIERIFSMVEIVICLRCCWLDIDTSNKYFLIMKN
jgi:hypothetical protein